MPSGGTIFEILLFACHLCMLMFCIAVLILVHSRQAADNSTYPSTDRRDRPAQSRVEMILQKTRKAISKTYIAALSISPNLDAQYFPPIASSLDIWLTAIFLQQHKRHSIKAQLFEEHSMCFPLERMFLNGKFAIPIADI